MAIARSSHCIGEYSPSALFNYLYQIQSITDPALEESNKGHRHLNGVLEELLGVEREAMASNESAGDHEISFMSLYQSSTQPKITTASASACP